MIAALALAALATACQTYSSQLVRAQAFYQESRYEDALAIFRYLGPNERSLEPRQRVRYYYLRGMTDVRLGFQSDARYWLALAQVSLKSSAGGLTPEEADRLELTLGELNQDHRRTMRGYVESVETPAMSCRWSSDCEEGYVCQTNQCVSTDS